MNQIQFNINNGNAEYNKWCENQNRKLLLTDPYRPNVTYCFYFPHFNFLRMAGRNIKMRKCRLSPW